MTQAQQRAPQACFNSQPRGSTWPRLFVVICLLAIWGGISAGCGAPIAFDIEPSDQCNLNTLLRTQEAYEKASSYDDPALAEQHQKDPKSRSPYRNLFASGQEFACFVLLEAGASWNAIQSSPLVITQAGELKALKPDTNTYEGAVDWKIPVAYLDKKIEVRLYILRQGQVQTSSHANACGELKAAKPDCFPANADKASSQLCWFFMKMVPKNNPDNPFKFASLGQSCKVCSREICGNNVDEDCDGTPDNGCGENTCHYPGRVRPCYTGPAGTQGKGTCQAGTQTCNEVKKTDASGLTQTVYEWGACQNDVKPKAEICNGLDDDCDGKTDEGDNPDQPLAGCCLVGSFRTCPDAKGCSSKEEVCAYSADLQQGAWVGCKSVAVPPTDECDGKDDDCDGQLDEDFVVLPCSTGQQGECAAGEDRCISGKVQCVVKSEPKPESCDGLDNDCNGQIDEGFLQRGQPCTVDGASGPCAKGILSECVNGKPLCKATSVATKELCGDGIDNDCDGKIDDADDECECKPNDTKACYPADPATKNKGRCKEGTQTCRTDGKWGPCEKAVLPETEICDGQDNDCDGSIDEDFPTKGKQCPTFQQGPCGFGQLQRCGTQQQNYEPQCVPLFQKAPSEQCNNGIDDDCNGLIDEATLCTCTPGATQPCSETPPILAGTGQCKKGTMTCGLNGFWGGCIGEVSPSLERCDGFDNDCNGKTDEYDDSLGKTCTVPNALGRCKQGRFTCASGRLTCTPIQPKAQQDLCDGNDEDCDGQIDEDHPTDALCLVPGRSGQCAAGKLSCQNGQTLCTPMNTAGLETCNGLDDDCNGSIDDNLTAPACDAPPKAGICGKAKKLCGGVLGWLPCETGDYFRNDNTFQPKETLCDGNDNDCDGQVDNQNGSSEPLVRSCYASADGTKGPDKTLGVGACRSGEQLCENGQWAKCQKAILPQPPLCGDNEDLNCNGRLDKEEPICGCWGSAIDGSLDINKAIELDTTKGSELPRTPASQRTQPDIVSYRVRAIKGDRLELDDLPEGIAIGDELLLLHMQGAIERVGAYALYRVTKIDKITLTIDRVVSTTFGAKDNTSLENQHVRIYRVPHYRRVMVRAQGTLSVRPWDGTGGGVLVFRAEEVVRVEGRGKLTTTGKGFRGGPSFEGNGGQPRAGESPSGWPTDGKGTDGGGAAAPNNQSAGSGAGGGHGTAGKIGRDALEKESAKGGTVYGVQSSNMEKVILFGAGGGGGSADSTDKGKDTKNKTGAGGAGGGIIMIFAPTINISGELSANGTKGTDGTAASGQVGAGGGGAGGAIRLQTKALVLYTKGTIEAKGGEGGQGSKDGSLLNTSRGGDGGHGRIDIRLLTYKGSGDNLVDTIKQLTSPAPSHTKQLDPICQ